MFFKRDVLQHSIFDMISKDTVFELDNVYYLQIRDTVRNFISNSMSDHSGNTILEIGPKKNHAERIHSVNNTIETVDIVDDNDTTYVADLTCDNDLPKEYYDAVYCLEVLEHTYEPWKVLEQLHKVLKAGGRLYVSIPFQFRIHGPLPDNYRISEFGLRFLLEKYGFTITKFDALIDSDRPAFPIHYTITCVKNITV